MPHELCYQIFNLRLPAEFCLRNQKKQIAVWICIFVHRFEFNLVADIA